MEKDKLLKKMLDVFKIPLVEKWYNENLLGTNQGDTIEKLENGISEKEITVNQALYLAFITGFQWLEHFETAQ